MPAGAAAARHGLPPRRPALTARFPVEVAGGFELAPGSSQRKTIQDAATTLPQQLKYEAVVVHGVGRWAGEPLEIHLFFFFLLLLSSLLLQSAARCNHRRELWTRPHVLKLVAPPRLVVRDVALLLTSSLTPD